MKKLILRPYLIVAALVLQLGFLFVLVEYLSTISPLVSFVVQVVSVMAMLLILNKSGRSDFKLPWIILILSAPILGGIVYFLTEGKGESRKQKEAYLAAEKETQRCTAGQLGTAIRQIEAEDPIVAGQFNYLERRGFPAYENTDCTFYGMADDAFPAMLAALESAEKYIFLEYFLLHRNSMWQEILEILERKAAAGVEVRVLYDDMATMSRLPGNYPRTLAAKGIRCIAFNRFIPVCAIIMNHRDHRKIMVVDGLVAFTGGYNLSDEYINREKLYGDKWKDTGVRLEGDAAYALTLEFLTMWNSANDLGIQEPPEKFRPQQIVQRKSDGIVQPYAHTPLEGGQILGDIYRNMMNQACRYVYIYTPYLIPDSETMFALCLAADRGVDVRLILPGVSDRKVIGHVTHAHYDLLLEHGVRLYEYEPGFVHAKCVVADDKVASVGTGNLDCRSLYHSYENGCLFYRSGVVAALRADFEDTLAECRPVEPKPHTFHFLSGVYYAVLRVFSPLL